MNKRAILYTRVSTDEQNNGYSPADQKDKLLRYCEQNNIHVVDVYHDDESAKTFNRPQWLNILSYLKKNKHTVDYFIFIKWDRFSRNIYEAYTAINTLTNLGVMPMAIEQPLDLEIPEQKLMLAFYLAAPEVDNDRRTLNIVHGMRRAKKEGRWLGTCPYGYRNTRDDNNKPIIVPEGGKKEAIIKKAFNEFATGLYNMEELRKELQKEGLKLTKNAFAGALRNQTYIGKVIVPKYKDEPAQIVEGLHEAIIKEETFYEVQDILSGRKKKMPSKIATFRDELPLRGYLICPRCGRTLTGSASTGRSGDKFYYYHCGKGCKERIKAFETNEEFAKKFSFLKLHKQAIELFLATIKKKLKSNTNDNKIELQKITTQIDKCKLRLKNAQLLMLDGDLSASEYRELKVEVENEITSLSIQENKLRNSSTSYDKLIDVCMKVLANLDIAYQKADTPTKQRIIGSIFPEKFIFENNQVRTTKVNEVLGLICSKIEGLGRNKKGQQSFFELLPSRVGITGLEPVTLCL